MEELAIILPAHNEEKTVAATIKEFASVAPHALIVVVNNASSDNTAHCAQHAFINLGCRGLLMDEPKKGKACAIRRAFSHIDAKIYVMADADCTYPASQLLQLIDPIKNGDADLVVGDRLSQGEYKKVNIRAFHNVGNSLIVSLINVLFNTRLNDILSGYRAFSNTFVRGFPIKSSGFELEAEITLHALMRKFNICEIPVSYRQRPVGSVSKLSTLKDGLSVISYILFQFFLFSREEMRRKNAMKNLDILKKF